MENNQKKRKHFNEMNIYGIENVLQNKKRSSNLLNPHDLSILKPERYFNQIGNFSKTTQQTWKKKIFRSSKLKQMCSQHKNKYLLNHAKASQLRQRSRKTQGVDQSFEGGRKNRHTLHKFCRQTSQSIDKPFFQFQKQLIIPYEMEIDLKKVYTIANELQKLQFSQKSISQWMSKFICKKNPLFIEIFMKIHSNQKSLSNLVIFQRQTNIQISYKKLKQALVKFPLSKSQYIAHEIKEMKKFMEEILIRKTQARIKEIQNNFNKKKDKVLLTPTILAPQIQHFMNDLKSIEIRNGPLQIVSKINRSKFEAIKKTEELFYNAYCDQRADEFQKNKRFNS